VSPSPEEVYDIFKRNPTSEEFCFQRTLEYECGEHSSKVISWIQCLFCDIPCECPLPWGRDEPILRFIIDRIVGRDRAMRLIPQLVSHAEHEIIAVVSAYDFYGKIEKITLFKNPEYHGDIGF